MTTFGDVLAFAPEHAALTSDVKGDLEHAWGTLPAAEIGAKGVFGIARELTTVLPDPDYNNTARFNVARAVHEILEGFSFTEPVAPKPQTLSVRIERSYREMTTLRELLEALKANPDDHAEILPFIQAHHQVRAVSGKSHGAWVIPSDDGIDLDATLAYVAQLALPHAVAQRIFQGRRPVNLDQALGINRRALIHPFTHNGVQGPDVNGFNLSDADIELIEALLWGAATEHSAWPQQIDLYACTEQILTDPLARRWVLILDDYRAAKAANDGNRLVNPYWPDGVQMDTVLNLAIHFGFGTTRPVSVNYQTLLEETSRGTGNFPGTRARVTGGVFTVVNIGGTRVEVDGVIALQGGNVSGTRVKGTIYVPPGVSINVSGTGADVVVITKPWEWLARHAGLI